MKKVKLGEMITFQRGYDLIHNQMKGGKIPVVGSSEIIGWHDEVKVKAPVLLIGRSGTVGRPQYYDTDIWAHNTTLFVSDFHGNDPKFCFYFLQNLNLENYANSSSVPTLNRNSIHPLEVPLPDLPTQTAIAKILSSLDEKIALNNKINKELEAMAKELYDYWFVQNAEESWELTKINDLLKKYTDTSGRIDAKNIQKEGKYPVITQDVGDLVKGYTNEDNPISDLPAIIFGDHSCTLRYIDFPFFRGADGTQLMYFENKKIINYIYYCMSKLIPYLPNFGKYERHFKYLKDFEILVPPTDLIDNFNNLITPIFSQINFNRNENYTLSQLRDFLLPMLMNGQVNIAD